jgi:caspase domain-containing protein
MKPWKPLVIGVGAIAVATATLVPVVRTHRGVRLIAEPSAGATNAFDRSQSAALFVGVRKFTSPGTFPVPNAADDAVDLAYMFALNPRVSLVLPEHVVIALSGTPHKRESKARLEELKQAGAKIQNAGQSDILTLLQRQAATAGKNGILIVSLATHGFVKEGVPYVLGSNSVFQYPQTSLTTPSLFDLAAKSEAQRSLFFIDACRERVSAGTRGGAAPATAAPLIGRMGRVHGQVVFYAAAAGGWAYDGEGNGVFTTAVLEGLNCKAALKRGAVTVETLRTYVERSVRTWIRENRDPSIRSATQVSMDGDSKNMPLALCGGKLLPPPPGNVDHAEHEGSTVSAFSANGAHLWSRTVNGSIASVRVADLDADGSNEVVVAADTLVAFDRTGNPAWSAAEGTTLRTILVEHLRRGLGLQVIALWNDERTSRSRVSMYNAKGQRLSTYENAGRLDHIAIDRPTARHGRKIIITGVDDRAGWSFGIRHPLAVVSVLDTNSKPVWAGVLLPPAERIARFRIVDSDNDSTRDISLMTATGSAIDLDFVGHVLKTSRQVTLKILPRHPGGH